MKQFVAILMLAFCFNAHRGHHKSHFGFHSHDFNKFMMKPFGDFDSLFNKLEKDFDRKFQSFNKIHDLFAATSKPKLESMIVFKSPKKEAPKPAKLIQPQKTLQIQKITPEIKLKD